jgi:UDP-N-acetylglucosamine acyltransferase
MSRIHPTAVIDARAEIHEDVEIGAHCVIEGPAVIGRGTRLRAMVAVLGETVLGEENDVFPGVVLGAPPQDLKYGGEVTRLEIGNRNRIREHVTIHPGTAQGGGNTVVGSDNLFMVGSHVAHDGRIGNHVVLSNHVLLAGHIRVRDGAVLNGACACHHFTTVGRLAYVGGLTRITQDVHPFTIVEGHPARIRACNAVGMERAGIGKEDIGPVKNAIYNIFVSGKQSAAQAMAGVEARFPDHPLVRELLDSIRASQAGRQGRAADPTRAAVKEGS